MKPVILVIAACCAAIPLAAAAKLPPPTPAEKAKLDQKAAAKAATIKRQEQELAQVQDEIVHRYRTRHAAYAAAHPERAMNARLTKADVPKAAQQPPGAPGAPHTGREPNPMEKAHPVS
jgi:hypothetical protein